MAGEVNVKIKYRVDATDLTKSARDIAKFGQNAVGMLGGTSTRAAAEAEKAARRVSESADKAGKQATASARKHAEDQKLIETQKANASLNAQKLIDDGRKRYAELEKKYSRDNGKQLIRDMKQLQDEKTAVLSAMDRASDKYTTAEINRVKKSYNDQLRMMKQLALDRDSVLKGGLGAAVGILGTGRNLISATPLGKYLGPGGAITAVLGGTAAMIKAGSDFETEITKAYAIAGDLTEQQKKRMAAAALEVGKATNIGGAEAAKGFYGLISAGMNVDQAIAALPAVARFAKAGMMDLSAATDLAVGSQNALGLASDDAATNEKNLVRVTDVLTKVNNLSLGTTQEFSEALSNKFGASLRVVHKDVEEGAAVLAVFAKQNVRGAEAGEAAAIVMRDLQTKAVANADAFKRYHISVYDATGRMRDMADIIGDLEKAFDGLSDKQQRQLLAQLGFSDRSIAHTLQLIGMSGAMRDYEKALRSAAGTTKDVADKQLQTFNEHLKHLKDIVEVDLIRAFNKFEPVLTKSVGAISGFLESKEFQSVMKDVQGFLTSTAKDIRAVEKFYDKISGGSDWTTDGKGVARTGGVAWTGGHKTYTPKPSAATGGDGSDLPGGGGGGSASDAETALSREVERGNQRQAQRDKEAADALRATEEANKQALEDEQSVAAQYKQIHEDKSAELDKLAILDVDNARKYNREKLQDEIDTAAEVLKITKDLGLDTYNAERDLLKARSDLQFFDAKNKLEDQKKQNEDLERELKLSGERRQKIQQDALKGAVEPAFRDAWGVASRDFFSQFDKALHADTNAVGAFISGFVKSFTGAIEGKAGKGLADMLFPDKQKAIAPSSGGGGLAMMLGNLLSGVPSFNDSDGPISSYGGPKVGDKYIALLAAGDWAVDPAKGKLGFGAPRLPAMVGGDSSSDAIATNSTKKQDVIGDILQGLRDRQKAENRALENMNAMSEEARKMSLETTAIGHVLATPGLRGHIGSMLKSGMGTDEIKSALIASGGDVRDQFGESMGRNLLTASAAIPMIAGSAGFGQALSPFAFMGMNAAAGKVAGEEYYNTEGGAMLGVGVESTSLLQAAGKEFFGHAAHSFTQGIQEGVREGAIVFTKGLPEIGKSVAKEAGAVVRNASADQVLHASLEGTPEAGSGKTLSALTGATGALMQFKTAVGDSSKLFKGNTQKGISGAGTLFSALSMIPGVGAGFGVVGTLLSSIAGFADGTDDAPGGVAWVGEDGPELMHVPRHAQIIPNKKAMRTGMYARSRSGSAVVNPDAYVSSSSVSGGSDSHLATEVVKMRKALEGFSVSMPGNELLFGTGRAQRRFDDHSIS